MDVYDLQSEPDAIDHQKHGINLAGQAPAVLPSIRYPGRGTQQADREGHSENIHQGQMSPDMRCNAAVPH